MAIALTDDRKTEWTPTKRAQHVDYPTSDGEPMAETDAHVLLILYHIAALRLYFSMADQPAYVAGNNFLYYEEGNPKARVSPDTYVVLGIPMRLHDSYKVWEEGGHTPAVVFEFTSRKTRDEDLSRKFTLYEQVLKVPEYFLFDPTADYLSPRLRGFRLQDDRYVAIPLTEGRMGSEQLHLDLVMDGERLRLFDPVTARFLPTLEESEAQRGIAEAQRGIAEAQRGIAEAQRGIAEAQRELEKQARAEAEAEVMRLRAELAALRGE
jgi:Uma2 family endonuclease